MRRFRLNRVIDETGISGTGYIAEGILFTNGKCILSWLTEHKSIAIYDTLNELIIIHGHNGKTKIEWID
jgi:hypothetical protein